jgi:hypothetical protein
LKLETDNGHQIRRLVFGLTTRPTARTLQGRSVAEWIRTMRPSNPFGLAFPGGPPPPPGGALKVVTTNLSGGWLRRNGAPYSENAVVTEYFDRFPVPNGGEWFVVTTVVDDPNLSRSFVTSSHFRREPDDSKWNPRPCRV